MVYESLGALIKQADGWSSIVLSSVLKEAGSVLGKLRWGELWLPMACKCGRVYHSVHLPFLEKFRSTL